MHPADLPSDVIDSSPSPQDGWLAQARAIAQGPLAEQVVAIDRDGHYPLAVLQQFARMGAMSAHLDTADQAGDYFLAIQAMAEASRVCGATGFMMWCQAVCGLYLQQSGNPALMGEVLQRHAAGGGMGGTALSNPMKSYAQIESLLLKATPVEGGYVVNGTLPSIQQMQERPDKYFPYRYGLSVWQYVGARWGDVVRWEVEGVAELALELQQKALGRLFANARHFHDAAGLLLGDGTCQLRHGKS